MAGWISLLRAPCSGLLADQAETGARNRPVASTQAASRLRISIMVIATSSNVGRRVTAGQKRKRAPVWEPFRNWCEERTQIGCVTV